MSRSEGEVREAKQDNQSKDTDVLSLIRDVREESLKIKELSEMEKVHFSETVAVMRQFIEALGKSYHLDTSLLSKVDRNISDVVLTPQALICLVYNDGSIVTRSLENLSAESLVRVLAQILPEIKIFLEDNRHKLSVRAGIIEKVAEEMKGIPSISFQKQRPRIEPDSESKTGK